MVKNVAPIITGDRECLGCGYNLRGLRLGINCPECGMPSTTPAEIDDPLSLMPTRVIVAFIRGCWVASLCVGAAVAAVITNRLALIEQLLSMMILAAVALLWVGATLWLTPAFTLPQAVIRGFSRTSRLRRAARWLQWGWLLAAGCAVAIALMVNPSAGLVSALNFVQWIGFWIGMAGIIVLSILLERLAEWTRDTDAETLFNWSVWGLPLVTPLLFVQAIPIGAHAIILLAWLVLACTFPYALLSLSKSVTLSILHSLEHRDRTRRRDERTREYHARVADTVATMDSIAQAKATTDKHR